MTFQHLNSLIGLSFLLPLVMLSSCIAGPDFSQSSDRAALEEAYRMQSAATAQNRERIEASTIEHLSVAADGADGDLRLSVSLKAAKRSRVVHQIFQATGLDHQIEVQHLTGRVSSRFSNVPFMDGLNLLLEGTGLVARKDSGLIRIEIDTSVMEAPPDATGDTALVSEEIFLYHLLAADAVRLLSTLYQKDSDFASSDFSVESVPELNAVFVSGPRRLVAAARATIARADRPAPHVIIEALVVDIDTSTIEAIGVSFADGTDGKFSALRVIPGQVGGNIVGTFSDLASNSAQVTATIEFLAARNAAEILARPYISSRNTQTAKIEIVNDQFVRVDTSSDDSSIISTDSVSAGVTMQITPSVLSEETVRLDVAIEESRFGATAGDIIISKQRNSASTSMTVQSGQTIVIGGLNSKNRITEYSGLPWLRNIPGLNFLAGEQGAIETRRQLVVYLTPYVWRPGQDLPLPLQNVPDPILPQSTSLERMTALLEKR